MATGTVGVRGGQLFYEMEGDGRTVVLLHGGMLDHTMWDEQFPLLVGAGYRVVRYDARRHGRSTAEPGDYAGYDDVHDLLTGLGLPSATLVGLSLGGRTAIDAALAYPPMVDALVLVAPGMSGMEFRDPFILSEGERTRAAADAHDHEAYVESVLRQWVDGPHRTPDQVDPGVRARCRALMMAAPPGRGARQGVMRELDAVHRVDELRVPVLAMVGDLDSSDIEWVVDQVVTRVPGARRLVVPGAGHVIPLDRPDVFNRALLGFLGQYAT
jgi:pimeloyl-ACP methyl ester carboxylesterase